MSKRLTTGEFIQKARLKHGNKYNYSKTIYGKNQKEKIVIICKSHGEFNQFPTRHLSGDGCPSCGGVKKLTTETFIQRAKLIHGDFYDYSKTIYGKNNKIDVIIICPYHREFFQQPNVHLSGGHCKACSIEKLGWTNQSWYNRSLLSKNFDSFKVYIIKCWNEDEEFYKIGKTYITIKKRFDSKKDMPYTYEVIKIIESINYQDISKLEKQLHRENYKFKYIPKIKFGGWNECFNNFISFHDDQQFDMSYSS